MKQDLIEHVNAAFSGLWIHTDQAHEAEEEIRQAARDQGWELAVWDIASGIKASGDSKGEAAGDPLAGVRHVQAMSGQTCLLVLHNLHRFLTNPELVQVVQGLLIQGKSERRFLVVVSPVVQLPAELEKLFVVLDHQLPSQVQLQRIAQDLTGEVAIPPEILIRIGEASSGMTYFEAEGAMALSLTRHGDIRPEVLVAHKAQALRKSNLLTLHQGRESFADIGGLEAVKGFCLKALQSRQVKPRGILLLGVPGTGKSALAKALSREIGRPTLLLDLGALMGSLVGQTEQNLRKALHQVDAMAPAVLFIDEMEKALAGAGGQGDSGVGARMFGTLLTWLSDHQSDIFCIGTCNDLSKLPPEFARAERFDGIFFLDLPTREEKDSIWRICLGHFDIADKALPVDDQWTGAEIKACCRLSALLNVSLTEAAKNVVPIALTNKESVDKLRAWATGRCLSASHPGVYGPGLAQGIIQPKRARTIRPSVN